MSQIALHEPVSAEPWDEDDYRVCDTCGTDLMALAICPDAPTDGCGCPLYLTRNGEHWPGFHDE